MTDKSADKTDIQKYKKLDPHEHVRLRPDTYVGATTLTNISGHAFVPDQEGEENGTSSLKCVSVSTMASPAFFKLFDEIIVNAMDNYERSKNLGRKCQKYIYTTLDPVTGEFSVSNDGPTIPIQFWEGTNRYIPEVLFFDLMSGENFEDSREEKVGGRNGLGSKVVNLLSKRFVVKCEEIVKTKVRVYTQAFEDLARTVHPPRIQTLPKEKEAVETTTISWLPDYAKLGMSLPLSPETVNLIKTRAFDAAACTSNKVTVKFNNEVVPVQSMEDYALAVGGTWIGKEDVLVERQALMEICVLANPNRHGSRTVGFVNGLQCSAGTHVDLVFNRLKEAVGDICKKRTKKACNLRPQQVRDAFNLVINARFQNPSFTSQTKEKCDLKPDKFGFVFPRFSPKFLKKLEESPVIDALLEKLQSEEDRSVQKSVQQTKRQKLSIPKYQRALKGQANLYVTEGDSAMAMALSGFSVIGRDHNGVFPLKGKLVNVYGMKAKTALENKEIMYLTQILQLEPHKVYDEQSLKNAPYRHIIIFTDQDHDGSHIMGLLLTFVREFFPSVLKVWPDFVRRFATPIIKAKVGHESRAFFSIPEYKEWLGNRTPSFIKYYKGLGTSTDEEAREYFENIDEHMTNVKYTGSVSEEAITTFFSADKSDRRKELLREIDETSCINYGDPSTTFEDFCFKELIHFCAKDNDRSIASAIDGFKPSQRKILETERSREGNSEIKVASLVARTMEKTAYHHGEASLVAAIMMMAQRHIGTNNIAFLQPKGQFGSRLTKRDEGLAAPRYVFTQEAPICGKIFRKEDDAILVRAEDDGKEIEPVFFVPIIPTVLINGCEGIGTGYKTSIPNFNPLDVIDRTRRIIQGESDIPDMQPFFYGFKGTVTRDGPDFVFHGLYEVHGNTVHIVELPPKIWSTPYFVWLQSKLPSYFVDAEQRSSKENVLIVLKIKPEVDITTKNLMEDLKLSVKVSLSQMHLFDAQGTLRKFQTPLDIVRHHYTVRHDTYRKRLQRQIAEMEVDVLLWRNKARFIKEIVSGKFVLTNKTTSQAREALRKQQYYEHRNFDYLLDMRIMTMTADEAERVLQKAAAAEQRLDELKKTKVETLWKRELDELHEAYGEYMEEMRRSSTVKSKASSSKSKTKKAKK